MKYQYFGLFLSEEDRNALLQVIIDNPIVSNLVFQRGSTIYLDHCTLLHKNQNDLEVYNALMDRIMSNYSDNNYRMIVEGIGISNKAIAFKVALGDSALPCANAKPHITVCTINGGKPVNSNEIMNWIPITEFNVYGKLKMV